MRVDNLEPRNYLTNRDFVKIIPDPKGKQLHDEIKLDLIAKKT